MNSDDLDERHWKNLIWLAEDEGEPEWIINELRKETDPIPEFARQKIAEFIENAVSPKRKIGWKKSGRPAKGKSVAHFVRLFYRRMRQDNPRLSLRGAAKHLARKYDLSVETVEDILNKRGIYSEKPPGFSEGK